MKSFSRRLQKLEAARCEPPWNIQLAEVCDCARRKLLAADRDLLTETEALLDKAPYASLSETHQAVWERWEDAFAMAIEETRFPWPLTAIDLRL